MRALVSCLLLFVCSISGVQAEQLAVDFLKGESSVYGLRLGYRPVEYTLYQLPVLGDIRLYMEASLNLWRYGEEAQYSSNAALAFSPVLVKDFTTIYGKPLGWELGIGVSLLDRRRFAGRDMGSVYQFEDRLGLRLTLSPQHSVSLRYMHYSNGGLNRPNPGIDFIALSYALKFH
ncbi:acyloxyacyl hydrolase [Chromatiaceae bacterium AAb-1]|nr:acyloxyacyl hydrolase [Chromatiaceae bacterium AAb-1]